MPPSALADAQAVSSADPSDRCSGWQFRGAIKQHLYMMMPTEAAELSQLAHLRRAIVQSRGRLPLGEDPFKILEDLWCASGAESSTKHGLGSAEILQGVIVNGPTSVAEAGGRDPASQILPVEQLRVPGVRA